MSACKHPYFKISTHGIIGSERTVTKLTCKTKGCGHYSGCRIVRRHEVTTGITMSLGGEIDRSQAKTEIREELCATPLFADAESPNAIAGVCRSCAQGWEAPGNEFANAEEKARALAVGAA